VADNSHIFYNFVEIGYWVSGLWIPTWGHPINFDSHPYNSSPTPYAACYSVTGFTKPCAL